MYETLFARAPDGHDVPALATGYSVDGSNVKITLRDDVTFSDGERFDADAVVANFTRGAKLGILAGLKPVQSVTAMDAHTVMLKLREPDPSLIDDLTLEAGMMIAPKAMEDPAL